MPPLPNEILAVLLPFAALFAAPTWSHVRVLIAGTLLAQGPRTVTAALRAMGLGGEARFERYHRVLNRARWSGLRGAQILLGLLLELLPPDRPPVVVVDETLERRTGARIAAKGKYRDPVRSTKKCVVTCWGLQWICMALLVPLPWSERPWALPFLALLAPSERANAKANVPHRTVVDWTAVMVRLLARWLGRRRWVLVGDGTYSCVELGWECAISQAVLVSRLRTNARLFAPPPLPVPGKRGRKPKKGERLKNLSERIEEAERDGVPTRVRWYGGFKTLRLLSETCLWHTPGVAPLAIRWVLAVDPDGELAPQAFFATDPSVAPAQIVEWFVLRWSIEVTFEEARRHLGVETQRQWSDTAIARTTPALFALFSIVCLATHRARECWAALPRSAAWYIKPQATFSDCLALVRRLLWAERNCAGAVPQGDTVVISRRDWECVLDRLASTA